MITIFEYAAAVLAVLAVAQLAPKAVNMFLLLVLIGIILLRYPYFQGLLVSLGNLGKSTATAPKTAVVSA